MKIRKRFLTIAVMLLGLLTIQCGTLPSCNHAKDSFMDKEWIVKLPNLKEGETPLILMRIPAGTFQMGSPQFEIGHEENESPVHRVTISRDFYLGKYEVTQAQWAAVMGGNPSTEANPNYPVNKVSWQDSQEFLRRLNELTEKSGFRLPSEAEFEYACRAGSTDSTYFGDNPSEAALAEFAWYRQNSDGELHRVGLLKPNAWGLYDMLGNVWEWCQDWYGFYSADSQRDPQGFASGMEKVFRGASWMARPEWIRCADRGKFAPDSRRNTGGFRVAFSE